MPTYSLVPHSPQNLTPASARVPHSVQNLWSGVGSGVASGWCTLVATGASAGRGDAPAGLVTDAVGAKPAGAEALASTDSRLSGAVGAAVGIGAGRLSGPGYPFAAAGAPEG